ncbi:S-layer homology domain-containing protein, partial [Domibacillus tundrae]|uniref:S-layer homology domain-containing protein n=1 Tax=Domibacillus tundrae TaxID=1587527 RepID=UPI00339902F0
IMKLAEAGIVTGNTDGTFAPKSNITRAETAIILARALGYGKTTAKPGFSDVSSNMKSYDAIAALTEAGIFAKASKFNPDKPLTRAQMARVLTQALGLEASVSASFSDVPATHWAKDEIDAVFTNGIMTGGTNARFLPENNITREQFAMTVYNVWSHSLIGTP